MKSWGIGLAIENATQFQDILDEAAKVFMILIILDLIFIGPVRWVRTFVWSMLVVAATCLFKSFACTITHSRQAAECPNRLTSPLFRAPHWHTCSSNNMVRAAPLHHLRALARNTPCFWGFFGTFVC